MPQELYLVGGSYELNNSLSMDVVEVYSTALPIMQERPLDNSARRLMAAGSALQRSIYICGGTFGDHNLLDSCLQFDTDAVVYKPVCIPTIAAQTHTNRKREKQRETEKRRGETRR